MSLSVNFTPTKTILCENACPQYTSRWVAAHNPIVFKLSSSLFPVAIGAVELTYINVTKSETGNARFAYSTFGSFDAADLIPGQFVKVSGAYSGEFRVIKFDPGSGAIELSTPFVSAGSGAITKAYRNYVAELKVFAGLPNAHKWKALKPETEIETLQQIPDQSGVAIFDIREAVQKKLNTLNDFELASLPNDVNIWAGFRVSYQERYDTAAGEAGALANITATGEVDGKQEFTVDTDLELIAGDFVVLQNFDDDDLNGAVIGVLSDNGTDVVLDLFYTGGLTLNGYETMQKFSTQTVSFQGGFTAEGNQYYAINAKLAPRSRYAGNMGEYLNNQNKTLRIKWISGFEGKKTWAGYYDDLGAIIDKTLTDSLATTETLAVQVVEKDRNGAVLDTQYLHIPNQEEGVYRLPYVQGIPPFIYELNSAIVISHLSYRRPAEFQYPPLAVDSSNLPTIEIDGTVQSARGDNFKFNDSGVRTTVRNREQFAGLCLRVEATNAGCFWDFSALGLTGVMTATVGWYKDSGGVVTLNKTLTGADPEIDNTNKRFIPQTDYKYHELAIFEDSVLFGRYFLEQRFDEVLIDSSGNGEHKTGSSVVTPALLWTSDNVPVSFANGDNSGFGYSRSTGTEVLDGTALTAGEIIPAITASLGAVGRSLQYRGRCAIDARLEGSPAIIFFTGAGSITFSSASPNTDLITAGGVASVEGTATVSSVVGNVVNFNDGVLESITLGNNDKFYFSESTGTAFYAEVNGRKYQGSIGGSGQWTTTDNNAALQAYGASKKDLITRSIAITGATELTFSGNIYWKHECFLHLNKRASPALLFSGGLSNVAFNTAGSSSTSYFRILLDGTIQVFAEGGALQTFGTPLTELQIFDLDGKYLIYKLQKVGNDITYSIEDGATTVVNNTFTLSVANQAKDFKVREIGAATGTSIRITGNYTDNTFSTAINELTLNTITRLFSVTAGSTVLQIQGCVDGFVSSAINAGVTTGFNAFGDALPTGSGFVIQDFGNSLKVNPNNVPLLRAGFGVDDTEELTYAQIVESVTGTGLDRFVKGGDTVEDYILADADSATPDDIAQIQNYENR